MKRFFYVLFIALVVFLIAWTAPPKKRVRVRTNINISTIPAVEQKKPSFTPNDMEWVELEQKGQTFHIFTYHFGDGQYYDFAYTSYCPKHKAFEVVIINNRTGEMIPAGAYPNLETAKKVTESIAWKIYWETIKKMNKEI